MIQFYYMPYIEESIPKNCIQFKSYLPFFLTSLPANVFDKVPRLKGIYRPWNKHWFFILYGAVL